MPEEFDVFLSHNSRDKPLVKEIGVRLRGEGLRVWLDEWELRPGFPWQEGIEDGVQASQAVAVFVGESGLGTWQQPEMRAFIARSRREEIPVIPVLLPGCPESPQLTLFLKAFVWVDLRAGLDEEGFARLVWGITGRRPSIGQTLRHNLPFPSLGALFQGRDEMLTLLHDMLAWTPAGRATALAGKAVHGLGGVGKTRLAVEYAWTHAAEYTALLFVVAGSPADLRWNLAALCARDVLDLPEQAATEEEAREEAVVRWLGERPGWLLILDNVDSEEAAAAVDRLVARLYGGQVLLTGRLACWSAEVKPLELDVLSEEAAVGFLLARTEKRRRATKEDAAHAVVLARELGFLPLALEQAGAYIAERRLTLVAYLEEWRSRHDRVLEWFDPRVSHYPASVAATWQTSFDHLSATARSLLERLAWLGPEPIPEALLDVPVPELTDTEPEADPRDVLVELATYSLVTRAAETPTFTIHRLVQDVTRCSLRKCPGDGALAEALRWVDAAFVDDPRDVRTWPILDPLAPHAHAVITHADIAGLTDPTARLMNDLGQLLYEKALLAEAEPLMRRALAIAEKSFGTEHSNVATSLNNLAQLLQATNRLADAEPLMRRALIIFSDFLRRTGHEHPHLRAAFGNYAGLLRAMGKSEAEIKATLEALVQAPG